MRGLPEGIKGIRNAMELRTGRRHKEAGETTDDNLKRKHGGREGRRRRMER